METLFKTIQQPNAKEIKQMEKEIESLNAKDDGWRYCLNMDSSRNFIGFRMPKKGITSFVKRIFKA